MEQVFDIAEYVASPIGRFVASPRCAHGFVDAGMSVLVTWGRPDGADLELLLAAFDAELPPNGPEHVSLTDARRLTGMDIEVFEGLARDLRARSEALARNTTAHAILRPEGMAGTIVASFYGVVVEAFNSRVFTDPDEALRWLGRDVRDRAALEAIFDRAAGGDPIVRALRGHLSSAYRDTNLARAARALGVAPRTLQAHLRAAGTSFRDELSAARIEVARALLEGTDTKLSVIALELGCASLQHFSTLFRRATGVTPSAFRAARRRSA